MCVAFITPTSSCICSAADKCADNHCAAPDPNKCQGTLTCDKQTGACSYAKLSGTVCTGGKCVQGVCKGEQQGSVSAADGVGL